MDTKLSRYNIFVKFAEGHSLKEFLDAIRGSVEEVCLKFSEDGISILESINDDKFLVSVNMRQKDLLDYVFIHNTGRGRDEGVFNIVINSEEISKKMKAVAKSTPVTIIIKSHGIMCISLPTKCIQNTVTYKECIPFNVIEPIVPTNEYRLTTKQFQIICSNALINSCSLEIASERVRTKNIYDQGIRMAMVNAYKVKTDSTLIKREDGISQYFYPDPDDEFAIILPKSIITFVTRFDKWSNGSIIGLRGVKIQNDSIILMRGNLGSYGDISLYALEKDDPTYVNY